jgi:hypothetical protein
VQVLERELHELESEFPNLVPPFDPNDFYEVSDDDWEPYYVGKGICAHLARVLGRLKGEIEQTAPSPVTEAKKFPFIHDSDIRILVERDILEAQRAYVAECWKSVIILSGGMIEAILTDLLLANHARAKDSSKAPKDSDITRWHLNDLIEVAVDLDLVSSGVAILSHSIRDYRNLVHPGNELRNKLVFGAEEARISLEVLSMVHRDLS